MKIFEAVSKACSILKDYDTPQLDAEVILSDVLKEQRTYLYMNRTQELSDDIQTEFFMKIKRRADGEPVQYITGRQEFMSLDFFVRRGVLIPRPDTEILVEEVLKKINSFVNPTVVDVGCGSGAISVSIAKYKADSQVYALDIMDTPLEVTRINAENNKVDNIKIIKSNLLDTLNEGLYRNVDVIVSNPPYIKDDVIPALMKQVKDYEPIEALSGREDGLYYYREISCAALKFLKKGGLIAYEIGWDQAKDVEQILKNFGYTNIECIKDLAGLDRVITGWIY